MPAASRSPTPGTTPAPSRNGSATATSSTPPATPSSPPTASRTSGSARTDVVAGGRTVCGFVARTFAKQGCDLFDEGHEAPVGPPVIHSKQGAVLGKLAYGT